jgi:hypothetical protein
LAQSDSIVNISVKAIEKNDSTYTIQSTLLLKDGWHVYDNNKEGITAPAFNASIESAQFLGQVQFQTKSFEQNDILFGKAKVFNKDLSFQQDIVIHGFQPDSLKVCCY